MRTYDFSPLWRSTIGFDRLFDLAELTQRAGEDNYPPYNIERLADDRYQISLAVAGFAPEDFSITAEQNVVTIEGSKSEKAEGDFLYRGISTRHFKRQFSLADYVQVKSAAFDNGLAQDRAGKGNPGSHEASPDRDQRRAGGQRTEAAGG
jgi:molecular chaperone IbpA